MWQVSQLPPNLQTVSLLLKIRLCSPRYNPSASAQHYGCCSQGTDGAQRVTRGGQLPTELESISWCVREIRSSWCIHCTKGAPLGVNPLPFLCLLCPVVSYSSSSTCPFPSKISRSRKLSLPFDVQPPSLRDDRRLRCSVMQQPFLISMSWGSKTFCSQWAGLKMPHNLTSLPQWIHTCEHTTLPTHPEMWLFPVHHTMLIPNTPGTQTSPPFLPHLPPQTGNELWNTGWKKCME